MKTKERLICTICKYVYGNSPRVRYYSSHKRRKDEKKKERLRGDAKDKKRGLRDLPLLCYEGTKTCNRDSDICIVLAIVSKNK